MEELLEAISKGDVKRVKKLLKEGVDPNSEKDGIPAIYWTENYKWEAINKLYENFSNPDLTLIQRTKKSYSSILRLLIESGVKTDLEHFLSNAVLESDFPLYKLILEKGIDVKSLSSFDLMLIFNQKDPRYARLFLKLYPELKPTTLPLQRSLKLKGKEYPLSLTIFEGKDSISLSIPFPKNYPSTDLKKNMKEIAYIGSLLLTKKRKKPHIYISGFYVHTYPTDPEQKQFEVLDEERESTRGLGKLLICNLIHLYSLPPRTKVKLIAGGARCLIPDFKANVKEIKAKTKEKFPGEYEKIKNKRKGWVQNYIRLFFL